MIQRYVVFVLRVVVPGGVGSGWRECWGWSGGGWSGGGGTRAAASAAPRKAALDVGIVFHLAQKKVVGGVAPVHLLGGRVYAPGPTDGYFFKSVTLMSC